jgi:hypothetical protein
VQRMAQIHIMSKQRSQGFPLKLKQVKGDPDAAIEVLLDTIKDNHPPMADEGRQAYRKRLIAIGIQLINEAGILAIRTTNDKEHTVD